MSLSTAELKLLRHVSYTVLATVMLTESTNNPNKRGNPKSHGSTPQSVSSPVSGNDVTCSSISSRYTASPFDYDLQYRAEHPELRPHSPFPQKAYREYVDKYNKWPNIQKPDIDLEANSLVRPQLLWGFQAHLICLRQPPSRETWRIP